eukprot:scaffold71210_cov78-Phaeocystis_antarctica.AAC.8
MAESRERKTIVESCALLSRVRGSGGAAPSAQAHMRASGWRMSPGADAGRGAPEKRYFKAVSREEFSKNSCGLGCSLQTVCRNSGSTRASGMP